MLQQKFHMPMRFFRRFRQHRIQDAEHFFNYLVPSQIRNEINFDDKKLVNVIVNIIAVTMAKERIDAEIRLIDSMKAFMNSQGNRQQQALH